MNIDDIPLPETPRVTMTRTGGHARQVTADEHKRLDRLLSKLQDCDLGDWDADFVDDMTKRIGRYGVSLFVSARQWDQLDRLARKHGLETVS